MRSCLLDDVVQIQQSPLCPCIEICLLTSERRVATVRAETYCSLFALYVEHFNAVLDSYPAMRRTLASVANERLHKLADTSRDRPLVGDELFGEEQTSAACHRRHRLQNEIDAEQAVIDGSTVAATCGQGHRLSTCTASLRASRHTYLPHNNARYVSCRCPFT